MIKNAIKSLLFNFIDFPLNVAFFGPIRALLHIFFLPGHKNDKNITLRSFKSVNFYQLLADRIKKMKIFIFL